MLTINQVDYLDREIKTLLKEIEEDIKPIEHSSSIIQERDLTNVENKINQANNRSNTMEIELRSVTDRALARKYKAVLKEHKKKIGEFEEQLRFAKNRKTSFNK